MHSVSDRFGMRLSDVRLCPFLCIPKCPTRDYLAGGTEFSYGRALSIVDDLAAGYADAGSASAIGSRLSLRTGWSISGIFSR